MKSLLAPLALSIILITPNLAHSADWTPAFEYLEQGKTGDDGVLIDKLMSNIFVDDIHSNNYKKINPLTKYAQKGNYPIQAPYRADLSPAKVYKNPNQDIVLQAIIPLKNATLYGLPISEFYYEYYCFECGGVGFGVKFAPMTNAQYRYLNRHIKFSTEDNVCDSETSASFSRGKEGTYLHLHIGC